MTGLRSVLALIALTTPALATPRIEPVLQPGGIPLPGEARAGTFCDRARHAVIWLDSGDAIAIDRKGALTTLGNLGRPTGYGNRIVCDRQDRVVAIVRDQLVILESGQTRSVQAPAQLTHVGLLGDGRVAVLGRDGTTSTWSGSTLATSWKTTAPLPMFGAVQFSPDGSTIAFPQRGAINLVDATGMRVGPAGYAAVWEGSQLVVATANRGLARWRTTDKIDDLDVVDADARGSVMFWAGSQLVQQLGPTATVRVLAAPPVITKLTRWPSGANTIAAGNASFMVIAGGRTAYVADITRDGPIVPELHASAPITDMVFSPDGKQLAITAGDAVLVAKLGARTMIERRDYPSTIFAPRLFWNAKGLSAVFLHQRVSWTSKGRDVVSLQGRGTALDEHGNPVDVSALCKQPYFTRIWRGQVAARCGTTVSFGLVGKPATYSTPSATSAFAIAGTTPVYADRQSIMIVGSEGVARELTRLPGFITSIVPSADGKRLAIVHDETITLWDLDRGRLMTAVNPAGRMARVVWSPDGSRLAVATSMAVAIWRL